MSENTTNDASQEIPYGYCHCGCGQLTSIASINDKRFGSVKGEPRRFVRGHYSRLMWEPMQQRFWQNVAKRGPDDCWPWTAHTNDAGYGMIGKGNNSIRAHRYSYELHFGAIPDGLHVLHHCDNPTCVNPAHLFIGDDAANMQDKTDKGRAYRPYGEAHGNRQFTERQIRHFRAEQPRSGLSIRAFARSHDVSYETMRRILKRLIYKDF